MKETLLQNGLSRRKMLGLTGGLAANALLLGAVPAWNRQGLAATVSQGGADLLKAKRAQFNEAPLRSTVLQEGLTMLSGPGGTVLVLDGPDGKVVSDTFIAPAWPRLKAALNAVSNHPVKLVLNTHWHIDHTDNNAPLHASGATIMALEKTKIRMAEAHDLPYVYRDSKGALFTLHVDAKPKEALPQQTFEDHHQLDVNGETLRLQHVAPAHTDTDMYVHLEKANVIQVGDLMFKSMYPYIDSSTGGKIEGMIAGTEKVLALADKNTKIIAGHGSRDDNNGPLSNKTDLAKFRDMLVVSRDRISKLKSSGKPVQEAIAEKPLADLDPIWGKGIVDPEQWVHIVYLTL